MVGDCIMCPFRGPQRAYVRISPVFTPGGEADSVRHTQTRQRAAPAALWLASASPRRHRLLTLLGWPVEVRPVRVDEQPRADEDAVSLAARLALAKARGCEVPAEPGVVLAADTVVADRDGLLGRPEHPEGAVRMLTRLRGRTHQVVTALALRQSPGGTETIDHCVTDVPMRDYTPEEVSEYVASGSPLDKAGAYGIQDWPFQPVAVDRLRGCYANVMGLPLCHLARGLRRLGLVPSVDVPAACMAETGYACLVYPAILREAK
jgi:MAF protein